MKHKCDDSSNYGCVFGKVLKAWKKDAGVGNKRKNRNNPDHSIFDIG